MGSPDKVVVLTYPHFWHSKLAVAKPDCPAPSLDNSMRRCRHYGQLGRSIAETCTGETG
jgi:hypothetical protein